MDEKYMRIALTFAKKAASIGEVPVGAVVVHNGRIIGTGYNQRETAKNALAHAELQALYEACSFLGGWRLHECDLYVTLEPCPMCGGAIINARIRNLYFGAKDPKAGCFGSVTDFCALPFNHHPMVENGMLEAECANVLKAFFRDLRNKNKSR